MQHYSSDWVIEKYYNGEELSYLFFWGHTTNNSLEVNKACLSQWFPLPFTVDGITYANAEHWMMANKALLFGDIDSYEKILTAKSPKEAKALGRLVIDFDELVWKEHCYEIVKQGNIHKFNQHPAYAAVLLDTIDQILVEASPVDKIWGIGLAESDEDAIRPNLWKGQNLLGFALMEVRDFLKEFGHFEQLSADVSLPWKVYPKIDPMDLFWRMGDGEGLLSHFYSYYNALGERERTIFMLTNPAPLQWQRMLA
jgi:ribA/ribD-fused uncharacterized protein